MTNQLPPQAYELMEARDEEQILAEIKGNIITEMFYSFRMDGREVTGISWVGTKEVARQYGGVDMDLLRVDDLGAAYVAVAKATDTRRGVSLLGSAMQSKTMAVKGEEQEDRFAYTKAVSKAQRNAIRAIIPEKYLLEMYQVFRKGAKPERRSVDVDAHPVEKPQAPELPAEDDETRRVSAVLEVNGLNLAHVALHHKGAKVYVTAGPTFPRDRFPEYDRILKTVKATWAALENRWEVPAA